MAKAATKSMNLPDFTKMSVPERSEWLLRQLRTLPGKVVVENGDRWLQLESTGRLSDIAAQFAPGLTVEQLKTSLRWMGAQKLRRSVNKGGGGNYVNFIKLEPEDGNSAEVPPAADAGDGKATAAAPIVDASATTGGVKAPAGGVMDYLAAGVTVMERAAAEIDDLRRQLAQAQQENARLIEENERLTSADAALARQAVLAVPFRDGLQLLRETLGESGS